MRETREQHQQFDVNSKDNKCIAAANRANFLWPVKSAKSQKSSNGSVDDESRCYPATMSTSVTRAKDIVEMEGRINITIYIDIIIPQSHELEAAATACQ